MYVHVFCSRYISVTICSQLKCCVHVTAYGVFIGALPSLAMVMWLLKP